MVKIEKLDDKLYMSLYARPRIGDYKEIWSSYRKSEEILKEAIKVRKDKWGERDIVSGIAISNCMLIDYKNINNEIYNELISTIYNNVDIARFVVNGASNGGCSFLLMSLWNHNLVLTDEQKAFAVSEAMNKIGTVKYRKKKEEYSRSLDKACINDEKITLIDIDGSVNPIGVKTKFEYMKYLIDTTSTTQAHGCGSFDIRYYILSNPNWCFEEKQKLVMDFWYDNEVYEKSLEDWEWAIINDYAYVIDKFELSIEKELLYNYNYEDIVSLYSSETVLNMFNEKDIVNRIWSEIQFCKLMHELRPMEWEKEYKNKNKILSK